MCFTFIAVSRVLTTTAPVGVDVAGDRRHRGQPVGAPGRHHAVMVRRG